MSNRLRRGFIAIPLVIYKVALVLALFGASFDAGIIGEACDGVVEVVKESVQPKSLSSNELRAKLQAGRARLLITDRHSTHTAKANSSRHSNHSLPNGFPAPQRC